MPVLTVKSKATEKEDVYQILWTFKKSSLPLPIGGIFYVSVPAKEDALILAELRGIYHLLEEKDLVSNQSLGYKLVINQSFGAIKKALAKGSIKKSGIGKTDKSNIALRAEFLATKYFEAEIKVEHKEKNHQFFLYENTEEAPLPWLDLRARIFFPQINEQVAITRHAMLRKIARLDLNIVNKIDEDDLTHVEDSAFTKTWHWFVKTLGRKSIEEKFPKKGAKTPLKYKNARYFSYRHDKTEYVFVIKKQADGMYSLVTFLRMSQARFLEKLPVISGQNIRNGWKYE